MAAAQSQMTAQIRAHKQQAEAARAAGGQAGGQQGAAAAAAAAASQGDAGGWHGDGYQPGRCKRLPPREMQVGGWGVAARAGAHAQAGICPLLKHVERPTHM